MYLKRLEIQGFKSFANKTVLEFEKGITAVVGPNGSGKSNIADAIRWVLGEQSQKLLRGKKSEDVIFAGSERKARMSFAEVSVTFNNEDRKIPIDYPEVSITRRIDRSGESDYLVNGNKVRLLDIVDLVLKSNIGTSRYTVIGQGTIDQMILSGPAEVKNLIDEASGVKTYYIRRDKTLKRLETTAQNLMRVRDLIAEIEPRLKSLRRQAKRMQERAAIEQELKKYQAEFYSEKYWQIQDAVQSLEVKLSVFAGDRAELEAELEKHRANLDNSSQANRGEVEQYQKVQGEIKKLLDRKNQLLEDVAMIRGKLQAQKNVGGTGSATDPKALDLEKRNLENAKRQLHAEIAKAQEEQSGIDAQVGHKRHAFAEVSARLADIQQVLESPEKITFDELAADVHTLEENFLKFYNSLEQTQDVAFIVQLAQQFRLSFQTFKQKALEIAQNPFSNFEKQKRALQEILVQKDQISQELNRLDLERSKVAINFDYAQKELVKIEQKILQIDLDLRQSSAENIDEYFNALLAQEDQVNKEIMKIADALSALEQSIAKYHSQEQSHKSALLEEERLYRAKQDQLSKLKDQESQLQIEKAKADTQRENILSEAGQALGDEILGGILKEKIPAATPNVEDKIHKLKNQLDMIGGIDELTLKEYSETETRYAYLSAQVADLQKGMEDLRAVIEELDVYIKKQFHEAFKNIDDKFQNYFRILFNGGRAYLSIVHPSDKNEEVANAESSESSENASAEDDADKIDQLRPEEKIVAKYEQGASDIAGIDIRATPPGKKLSSISALSGGERALTSIALLCSLLSCFPSPFVVLDEVDAALDEANTIRFAEILGTLEKGTQFIGVSHNRETMRKAHTLYGVTMGDDSVSKILSLKIDQAQAYAK